MYNFPTTTVGPWLTRHFHLLTLCVEVIRHLCPHNCIFKNFRLNKLLQVWDSSFKNALVKFLMERFNEYSLMWVFMGWYGSVWLVYIIIVFSFFVNTIMHLVICYSFKNFRDNTSRNNHRNQFIRFLIRYVF